MKDNPECEDLDAVPLKTKDAVSHQILTVERQAKLQINRFDRAVSLVFESFVAVLVARPDVLHLAVVFFLHPEIYELDGGDFPVKNRSTAKVCDLSTMYNNISGSERPFYPPFRNQAFQPHLVEQWYHENPFGNIRPLFRFVFTPIPSSHAYPIVARQLPISL